MSKDKVLVITDLHIGRRGKSKKLVDNLIIFFIDNKKMVEKLDMIVVDGDTFDKLLSTNSDDYGQAVKFITYLFELCSRYKISLRWLEGTPSHDNKQMSVMGAYADKQKNLDYRYLDSVTIEYNQRLKKHLLFVPDKMSTDGEEIKQMVATKLTEHSLTKVDLCFMHGNFKYQLPITIASALDEDYFISITRYYIVIGHIHMRSIWKTIIAPGSFDRIEVNQEFDKGGVLLTLGKDIDDSIFEFINNINAILYDTVDVREMSIGQAYKFITKHIRDRSFGQYDHLRLRVPTADFFKEIHSRLVADGHMFDIVIYSETKKTVATPNVDISVVCEGIDIRPDNIVSLLDDSGLADRVTKRERELIVKYITEFNKEYKG